MLDNNDGKLLVYASTFAPRESRLKTVSMATEKMAKQLKVNMEIVKLRKRFTPIYVYYKNGDEEPIPIYCNNGEKSDLQKIYTTLRNMMFVLSFHPKHNALKQVRREIMLFS
jgi:roadblock/LC7 domain-containing protein